MFQVKKRDGSLVEFDMSKISTALSKAFNAQQTNYTADILNMLTLRVTADFSKKIKDNVITVEDIQDSAEVVLIQAGYVEVAKSYMLYRKQHENVRNIKDTIVDYKKIVDGYLKCGYTYPRPFYAYRLLRGLVFKTTYKRGARRRSR